jgi:hypothetical protein
MTTELSKLPDIKLKPKDRYAMFGIAAIILAIIAIPVLTWTATVMALIQTILADTVWTMVSACALFFGGWAIVSNWTNIIYAYKNMSRNVARTIARENPLGVMDTAISRFEQKLEQIGSNLATAKAALLQQQKAIKQAADEQKNFESLARNATDEATESAMAAKAERRRKSAEAMQPMADTMEQVYQRLTEARQVCMLKLDDMKDNREVFGRQYATMMAGAKAVGTFRSFFASNPDLDMLTLSIDQIEQQTSQAEAEIDQFLTDIQPIVSASKLQSQVDTKAALERIKGSKLLTEGTQPIKLAAKEGIVINR